MLAFSAESDRASNMEGEGEEKGKGKVRYEY
jgi:hypothetical protein